MKLSTVIFHLVLTFHLSRALRCTVCKGTPAKCKGTKTQPCGKGQVCRTDYFYRTDGYPRVNKRCQLESTCTKAKAKLKRQNENTFNMMDRELRICCCNTWNCDSEEHHCRGELPTLCARVSTIKNANGDFDCNPDKKYNAMTPCTLTCGEGYDLDKNVFTCTSDDDPDRIRKPRWEPPQANCQLTVKCPFFRVANGKKSCTNPSPHPQKEPFRHTGTTCKITCGVGFTRDGPEVVECTRQDGKGVWTQIPKCVPDPRCAEFATDPNRIDQCTNGEKVGSDCSFACDEFYELDGVEAIQCASNGGSPRWTDNPPTCKLKITCKPERFDIDNGRVSCNDTNMEYSVCAFTCDEGYDLSGTTSHTVETQCMGNRNRVGRWTRRAPACVQIRCRPPHTDPSNGAVSCTNSNIFKSRCDFQCSDGYDLVESNRITSECQDDGNGDAVGQWSHSAPSCGKNTCEDIFGPELNGDISYSDDFNVGTIMTLTCNGGYSTKDNKAAVCLPIDRSIGKGEPYWNVTEDVCCVACGKNQEVLVASLIDKTAARNEEDWVNISNWQSEFMTFMYRNGYNIRYSVVLYDDSIDETNSIRDVYIGGIAGRDLLFQLLRDDIQSKPHFGGTSSDTEMALAYVRDNIFEKYNRNLEPYLYVVKRNGPVTDASETIASEIRDIGDGVNILAVGVGEYTARPTAYEELTKITQNRQNAFMIADDDARDPAQRADTIAISFSCNTAGPGKSCPLR